MFSKQFLIFIITTLLLKTSIAQVRSVTLLSDGWKFSREKNEQAFQPDFNDKN